MAALAAATNSSNGTTASTGQSQSGTSTSGAAAAPIALSSASGAAPRAAIAILGQAPQGAVSKSFDTPTVTSRAVLLRELEEVERELHSPNIRLYQSLIAPAGNDPVFTGALERILPFPENADLLTMYEHMGSCNESLRTTVKQLEQQRDSRAPIEIEEQGDSDRMALVEQLTLYWRQYLFITQRTNALNIRVKELIEKKARLEASLGTAVTALALLPAAVAAVEAQPKPASGIFKLACLSL